MSEQTQEASEGAVAVQSGRDTIVYQGVTPDQMKTIVETLANQMLIPMYAERAREVVEARLLEFETSLMTRFATDEKARRDAFAEPDFQAVVVTAQRAHARVGDDRIRDTLVDLIAERSAQRERTRLSLSLNEAVQKSALLTHQEFGALSFCYLLKYTLIRVVSFDDFADKWRKLIVPLLPDVDASGSSLPYLIAQGCAASSALGNALYDLLKRGYEGLMSKGFDQAQLHDAVGIEIVPILLTKNLILQCFHDQSKLQVGALNRENFDLNYKDMPLSQDKKDALWKLHEGTLLAADEFKDKLVKILPEAATIFDVYEKGRFRGMTLTSVGIAIGHANSRRVSNFDADLSTWIK